jgi:hemolysin III
LFCRIRFREPFSGLSHLGGALLSAIGLVVLVVISNGKPWHLTAFAIYGASLILLFSASALYHLLPVGPHQVERLRCFDQVAIYLLIAGTYTPVCLISLRGPWGWSMLAGIWGIALAGSAARVAWRRKPEWLTFVLYLFMGWASLIALSPLSMALKVGGLAWLFVGGFFYTVGAAILAADRPRLWPGKFGSHDLWHVFVLGGSACHFVMMLRFVAVAP